MKKRKSRKSKKSKTNKKSQTKEPLSKRTRSRSAARNRTAKRPSAVKQAESQSTETDALSFNQVQALVKANKKSPAFTDECIIAVCWKESSFNPSAQSGSSTAKGLMQMTNPAVDTVNNITPSGVHFEYADMLDGAKAVQCGSYYLQWCSDQAGGDEAKALNKFAGVGNYATNVMAAESCLLTATDPPMSCLQKIHPFLMERRELKLMDSQSGESRFMEPSRK